MIQLETRNLGKTYSGKGKAFCALRDVNLQIEDGEFVGIMGPSGAGKSTLLHLLATIDRPTTGSVYLKGRDVFEMGEEGLARFRRKNIGFIFQDYNLLEQMTAYENMTLPMMLAKIPRKEQQYRALELSKRFGVENLLDKTPIELSGGEQQRITAARAMIMNPAIVLADEPTGALDSKSGKAMMELLQEMNREQKVTIVMVTHDPKAAQYCSRIISIEDGQVSNQ